MKQIYVILFFSLFTISNTCRAQEMEWFAEGTTWTYNYQVAFDWTNGTYQKQFGVTEHTEFMGVPCAKVEVVGGGTAGFGCMMTTPPYYFYKQNDSIFYATELDSVFRLAFDFNAEVGDQWDFEIPTGFEELIESYQVTVISLENETVPGLNDPIKKYTLNYSNTETEPFSEIYPPEITIYEYFGSLLFFIAPFPYWSVCDGEMNIQLQCFQSGDFSWVAPGFDDCLLSAESIEQTSFELFPNPADDKITIRLVDFRDPTPFSIYTPLGQEVRSGNLTQTRTEIDLSDLPNGMYLIRMGESMRRFLVVGD